MSLFLSLCHAVWLFSADGHVGVALQFESGYFVETLVEGDKLGVTPHTIRVSPVEGGELLAVDSAHSNIVRITPPLSECMFHFPPPLIGVCFILLYILFIYHTVVYMGLMWYVSTFWWIVAIMAQCTLDMIIC